MTEVRKAALISPCGRYRYWLERVWDPARKLLPFVMLNPSTADAEIDDPTIRRCMAFARREGYGGIWVVNLYALRATDPAELLTADDPVGPDNNNWVQATFSHGRVVVAAWGAKAAVVGNRHRWAQVTATKGGCRLHHLGLTQEGHPKHPLARGKHRVPDDQPLVRWT